MKWNIFLINFSCTYYIVRIDSLSLYFIHTSFILRSNPIISTFFIKEQSLLLLSSHFIILFLYISIFYSCLCISLFGIFRSLFIQLSYPILYFFVSSRESKHLIINYSLKKILYWDPLFQSVLGSIVQYWGLSGVIFYSYCYASI